MDQHGRREYSTGAGNATYLQGVSVYDAGGEKLGTVSARQDKDDFLVVHKGRLFGHDTSIPRAAIDKSDSKGIYLVMRKDELKGMKQTALPAPIAPITNETVDTFATDQPLTVPLTSGIPVPDLGIGTAALAAIAFSSADEPAQDTTGQVVETAREGAGQATDGLHDQSAPALDAMRDPMGPVVDQVRERVGPVVAQVNERASAAAHQQMTSAADGLEGAAGAVNSVGDQLREHNLTDLSHYTDRAAEQIEKAATWLRTTTPQEIAHEVEDFAKRQPTIFVAGALALGLLGVRFLRSAGHDAGQDAEDKK